MNKNINNYNEKEVKNKLKSFREGKDYSVSPTEEPEVKTYSFFNDELKSWFRNDRIPVKVTREAYDGKDYTYRGHFEEGKDYYYSRQDWHYGENYQGKRGTEGLDNISYLSDGFKDFMGEIKWDEHYRENLPNRQTIGWVYRGKGKLNGNNEPKKIENGFNDDLNLKTWTSENDEIINYQERLNGSRLRSLERGKKEFEEKLAYYKSLPAEERKNKDIISLKDRINFLGKEIEEEKDWINLNSIQQKGRIGRNEKGSFITDKEDNNSDLQKENQELKQQLSEVKNQLKEVLEELKKLRNSSTGQNKAELDQQIDYNERIIRHDREVPEVEIKEQVKKSQDLLNKVNSSIVPTKNNPGSGSLPYVIGGAVIIGTVAIIGYYLWSGKRKNKIS